MEKKRRKSLSLNIFTLSREEKGSPPATTDQLTYSWCALLYIRSHVGAVLIIAASCAAAGFDYVLSSDLWIKRHC